MLSYCLKREKNTESINPKVSNQDLLKKRSKWIIK